MEFLNRVSSTKFWDVIYENLTWKNQFQRLSQEILEC